MQVTETLSDGLKRGYTVVVPAATIEGKRTARLTELGKTLRLPGFRPGKVPMPVVRQRYGTAVMAEVLEESVSSATRQMLSDRGLRPANQPKVEMVSLDPVKDLEFNVELELMPEIPMPDFGAISLTRLRAEVADEEIDKVLTELAGRQRKFEDSEEVRPAATGDFLQIDYLGSIDGTPFPGGTGTDTDVEIGGTGFIPGFTEGMEGMSPGETRTIDVTFPEGYQATELAGKAAKFEITAKKLRTAVTQAIDDELAKAVGMESLEALRDAIRQQSQREYDQLTRLRLKRALLDALAEAASFTVPETMVNGEFDQIWKRVDAEGRAGKLDADDAGKDEETLKAEYRAIAERRVRLGLLLSEIGRVNTITVANEELIRAMRAEAGKYPGQEQMVMEFFRKNPEATENLRGPLFEDKVVDFIIELAKVEDQKVSREELMKEPDDAAALPQAAQSQAAQPQAAHAEVSQPQADTQSAEDAT